MSNFIPKFQYVSRNTTRSDIVNLNNRRKGGLIEEFKNGSFCVALTMCGYGDLGTIISV